MADKAKEFFSHAIDWSKNNLNKIKNGVQTAIKSSQIGTGMTVHFSSANHKRIMSAHRRGKGVRVKLTPEEIEQNKQEGTGLGQFLHSIGIHNGVRKLKNTGKAIGRAVLPALGSMAGDALAVVSGNPELAPLGQALGNQLGSKVANSHAMQNGRGLFRTLHKVGISKKMVVGHAKKLAKKGLEVAVSHAKAKAGDNALAHELINTAHAAANMHLDDAPAQAQSLGEPDQHGTGLFRALHKIGISKKSVMKAGKSALNAGISMAKEQALNHLPQAKELIHKTVLSHTGNANLAGLVADHAHNVATDAINQHGNGVVPFEIKKATKKLHRVLGGEIDSAFKQGYSSVLAPNNPAMNPFVEYDSPYQPNPSVPKNNRRIKGGSFQ